MAGLGFSPFKGRWPAVFFHPLAGEAEDHQALAGPPRVQLPPTALRWSSQAIRQRHPWNALDLCVMRISIENSRILLFSVANVGVPIKNRGNSRPDRQALD